MRAQWINFEHSRWHQIEEWPDGPRKQIALAAIRSALASLTRLMPEACDPGGCSLCESRKRRGSVLEWNTSFQNGMLPRAA